MRVVVLVNAGAGGVGAAAHERALRIVEAFARCGVEASVRQVAGAQLRQEAVRAAAEGWDAVVAAGGDGTVSAVACALVDGPIPLGVLPLGTLNHFAKDLGLPLELDQAVEAVARGTLRRVDVGEVNSHVFVNNSSIGLYPHVVRNRERLRGLLGKWGAMAWASVRMLLRLPRMGLRLSADGRTLPRRTPFVFVGNNRYEPDLLTLSRRRPSLDGGRLCLYVARTTRRLGILGLALRALFGRLRGASDLDEACPRTLEVRVRRRRLQVSADGEVIAMRTPLHYRIRPRALPVLVPEAP